MRRKERQRDESFAWDVLKRAPFVTVSMIGEDGAPYSVPVNAVVDDAYRVLYFHCAKAGHKLDAIRREARASFCVVDRDEVVPEEYTTYFRSVIAFGRVRVIEDEAQKRAAIELLACRYFPQDSAENRHRAIEREWAGLCMLEMDIEHLSGKEAVEFARKGDSKP